MTQSAEHRELQANMPQLSEHDLTLVEQNFSELMSFSDALAERFYQRLFTEYPEIHNLFKSVTIEGQHKKLLASMVLLIKHLRDSAMIADYLQGLGMRHVTYGVQAGHYEMFIENWLVVAAEFADQNWNENIQSAWRHTLEYVAFLMQMAPAAVLEPHPESTKPQVEKPERPLTSLALAQTATPMLIVDLDLVIRYFNGAAESLLTEHQPSLKTYLSTINSENFIGSSLHQFADKLPFPLNWFKDYEQLPRSVDLKNTVIDLKLTISVLYNNDVAEAFLLECYPQSFFGQNHANDSQLLPVASPAVGYILSQLEKYLHDVQHQHIHLNGMLQEVDDAVYEAGLLAMNCTTEASRLGDEARRLREYSREIRSVNHQVCQLIQSLKLESNLKQQQLNKCFSLLQQIESSLPNSTNINSHHQLNSINQISHQLSQQTQALTQLIGIISPKPEH